MGHYASEMDPNWGQTPTPASVQYPQVDYIADRLLDELYRNGYGPIENVGDAVSAVQAIDAFVTARFKTLLDAAIEDLESNRNQAG